MFKCAAEQVLINNTYTRVDIDFNVQTGKRSSEKCEKSSNFILFEKAESAFLLLFGRKLLLQLLLFQPFAQKNIQLDNE